MRNAKNATLVLCLFVLYCVLLSQGLKASAASAFFGALAAVPLTVHLYHRCGLRRSATSTGDDYTGGPQQSAPARWKASTNRAGLAGPAAVRSKAGSITSKDHAGIRCSSKGAVARLSSAHNSRVDGCIDETWLDAELPKIQNLRVDLLGETAEGSLVHLEL